MEENVKKYVHLYMEKDMATHSTILAWEIPWTEQPDGLQSIGSQRVGYDLVNKQQQQYLYICITESLCCLHETNTTL